MGDNHRFIPLPERFIKAFTDKQLLALEEYNKERLSEGKEDAEKFLTLINKECLSRGLRYDKSR